MPQQQSHRYTHWVTGLTAIALATLGSLSPAIAQTYQPSGDIGVPGRRQGGGTRSGQCLAPGTISLTALMPESGYGQTTAALPTLYVYIPASQAGQAEFRLYDEVDNIVYAQDITLNGATEIIAIPLAATANFTELPLNQPYRWDLLLTCTPNDFSANLFIDSWIERVEPPAQVTADLAAAPTEIDQATIYAEAGLWFEALDTLAALRIEQNASEATLTAWETLLDSVNLHSLIGIPLVNGELSAPIDGSDDSQL